MSSVSDNGYKCDGILTLCTTPNMKNAGISDFLLNKEFIFRFDNGGMCAAAFNRKTDSTPRIMKRIKEALENRIERVYETLALRDIENQLIEKHDEIFSRNDKLIYTGPISQEDKQKSQFQESVTKLKKEREESNFTFEDWQQSVQEKYNKIRLVMEKNFPGAWPMLQFCLAVKSILNNEGCTLPFMGVILAIPSSMKTLVIQLFRKYPHSLYSDNFTPHAFQSHNAALNEEQLRKNDLLPRLHNKLFLTSELAPIFTANEDELRKSLGIITRVLDGHGLETDSGAQGHRKYGNTFFVWVGAAVEIPYRVWTLLGTLGHKIYFFRPEIPEKTVNDLGIIAKENDFLNKFEETENALLEYLVTFDAAPMSSNMRIDPSGIVKVKWDENKVGEQNQAIACIARVANLLKRLRGIVYISRSKAKLSGFNSKGSSASYENKPNDSNGEEIQHSNFVTSDESDYDTDYPIVEDPSRAVILLRNLALGNAISQGRDYINMDDMPLVVNVALSTTTRARSELIKLLLEKNGQLTTYEIVRENKVSAPFAKRTMRELSALRIVDIEAVAGYKNSELKISLTDEYSWFKEKQFKELYKNKKAVNDSGYSSSSVNSTNGKDTNHSIDLIDTKNEHSSRSRQLIFDPSDTETSQSHAETKSTIDTHAKNAIVCDNFKESSSSDCASTHNSNSYLTENSNQFPSSEKNNDGQSKVVSSNNPEPCDTLQEKNNMPLRGSESIQHVTPSLGYTQNEKFFAKDDGRHDEVMNFIIKSMVATIRIGKGSIFSLDSILRSIYDHNENVREYLGDKITQRENRKIRKIYLAVIHYGDNIEVVKTRPQVTVRWVNDPNSGHSDR